MAISQGSESGGSHSGLAASLLFAAGRRPDAAAVREFAESTAGLSVSFGPSDGASSAVATSHSSSSAESQVWLELLTNGLTFDLVGLRPGVPPDPTPCVHAYELGEVQEAGLEALTVRLGPHIAGGHALPVVVRSLAWLAATLSALDGVEAVAWHPARTCSGGEHFRAGVLRWIEGGAFPGLSLSALALAPDGGMQSEGLALFAGQDLRIEPELVQGQADAEEIAVRLIDYIAENGPINAARRLVGPDGQPLRLELSANGRFVRVWRG